MDNEIKTLCEKTLPLAVASKLFGGLKRRIEAERGSIQQDAIRDNAAALTQTLLRAVEEPEPLYRVPLNAEQRAELGQRILKLLRQGMDLNQARAVLNLSEREAARILHRIEEIESSDIFRLTSLLDEKRALDAEIQRLDRALQPSASSASERELFEQLQAEMESCSTQIGRKSEQLRALNEDILNSGKAAARPRSGNLPALRTPPRLAGKGRIHRRMRRHRHSARPVHRSPAGKQGSPVAGKNL